MANPQGSSSFIPKNPAKGKVKTQRVRKIYLLSYLSYILFFGTLMATIAVFVYGITLNSQLDNSRAEFEQVSSSFSQSDLERVRELDKRINTAEQQIENHISIVSILEALETSILSPVDLLEFEYLRSNQNQPQMRLVAQTDSFNALLFQNEVLASNPAMQAIDLSDIALITVPVDPLNLQLGTKQVVSVTMRAALDNQVVNFAGAQAGVRSATSQLINTEIVEEGVADEADQEQTDPSSNSGAASEGRSVNNEIE